MKLNWKKDLEPFINKKNGWGQMADKIEKAIDEGVMFDSDAVKNVLDSFGIADAPIMLFEINLDGSIEMTSIIKINNRYFSLGWTDNRGKKPDVFCPQYLEEVVPVRIEKVRYTPKRG